MKNYEFFNNAFKQCESAEVQAFKSVINEVCQEENIEKYVTLFKLKLAWLKEEKE